MKNLIAGLKWLATYLENRFPPKFHPENFVLKGDFKAAVADVTVWSQEAKYAIDSIKVEQQKLKEQVEKLSLYIGFSRPMQTVLREKLK